MILDGEMTQHRRAFSAAREEAPRTPEVKARALRASQAQADPLVHKAGSGSTKQVDRERLLGLQADFLRFSQTIGR